MITFIMLGSFLALMMARVPVSIAITVAAIVAIVGGGYSLVQVPQIVASSTKSVPLMAIPFFILAANLMNAFGISQKIFDFATAAIGFMRGGLAQVNVLASMIFAGISGAAVADAAGLGTIEVRAMDRAGYKPDFSAAVTLASSTIGPIIPPSIMMLIYSVTANVSPAAMFLAGLVPGAVIGLILMATIYFRVVTGKQECPDPIPFSLARLARTAVDGLFALVTPVIILWGMVGGVVTPTEAGVLAVAYSLVLGAFYRTLRFRELRVVLRETSITTAHILYILAVSHLLSYILVSEGVAYDLSDAISRSTDDPYLFLVLANIFLLILGCLLETLPAMLIAVPVFLPAVDALGIDRVHFGVVVIFNLLVGIITPPMGIGLYILISISRVRFGELVSAVIPYLITLLIALGLITFVPALTLFLPNVLLD
jgi:tripartite ATP-independent transporter DctM subunit